MGTRRNHEVRRHAVSQPVRHQGRLELEGACRPCNDQARKLVARFRAYETYEASFRDYARLINESPRYAKARQSTGSVQAYAAQLQQAGYATDPAYGSKLSRAISMAVRLQA